MNTRLQVEHPVTEMVTGLDLVELQIRIAAGEKLPFEQGDVHLRGHAVECRLYAEDPENNFFPSPGKIDRLLVPAGPGIREDSGVYEGWTVPLDYDPLLSKLIAWAPTRPLAIARMQRALREYFVGGIKTNLGLFRWILEDAAFQRADFDTSTLDRMLSAKPDAEQTESRANEEAIAALAAVVFAASAGSNGRNGAKAMHSAASGSAWKRLARQEALRE